MLKTYPKSSPDRNEEDAIEKAACTSEQSGESSACSNVFVVQMVPAERLDQIHNGIMLLPHLGRNGLTAA